VSLTVLDRGREEAYLAGEELADLYGLGIKHAMDSTSTIFVRHEANALPLAHGSLHNAHSTMTPR